jgi:hypothetical protein
LVVHQSYRGGLSSMSTAALAAGSAMGLRTSIHQRHSRVGGEIPFSS